VLGGVAVIIVADPRRRLSRRQALLIAIIYCYLIIILLEFNSNGVIEHGKLLLNCQVEVELSLKWLLWTSV
jgi:hypothetical protein